MCLSFGLPWWKFIQFQGERGLQVESIYASILWLGDRLGFTSVQWAAAKAWREIHGPPATMVLPWARGVFVVAVALSSLLPAFLASYPAKRSIANLARLLLVPLLGFVSFNTVFSPQFMIWLIPIAALASMEGSARPALAVVFATMLTPCFFPCKEYSSGLNLFETVILNVRNLTLVTAWLYLMRDIVICARRVRLDRAES